ncbi:glycosyltransferase family 2 protein [Butyrivibrio fibrisolvens]|uniref:glycosyltransferase family 2 protein n=1 Tax=Butyrivibrio fibrisolvens TaxID=831 RepID=UPI0004137912|nr:glycosyltransferase [Butyrivibrio fibrisolvens]
MEVINSKLSIIVPVYNIERYVGKCIESIIGSTYNDLEIILVDDGSTDDSGNICDSYKQRDDRIIVVHKANGGLVSARKAGVSVATGEYAAFVDGDDFVDKSLFRNAINKLFESEADMICYGYTGCNSDGIITNVSQNKLADGLYKSNDYPAYYDEKMNALSFIHAAWNKVYKTSILKNAIKDVDDTVTKGEDLNLILSYLKCSSTFVVDNSIAGYYYVDRNSSMTHVYDDRSIEHTANYVRSSLKLCYDAADENANLWNKLVYNEAFNLIKSDCIGCAFDHYGKKRIFKIIHFFREMSNNSVFYNMFKDGLSKYAFSDQRKEYARLMVNKSYIMALILRLRYKEL